MAMKKIVDDLQKQYEEERQKKVEVYKKDQELTEYAQTRLEYHKALGNNQRADFYDWILSLVDRLEEAEFDKENLLEQVEEHEIYIRELEVEDDAWKDTWYKR